MDQQDRIDARIGEQRVTSVESLAQRCWLDRVDEFVLRHQAVGEQFMVVRQLEAGAAGEAVEFAVRDQRHELAGVEGAILAGSGGRWCAGREAQACTGNHADIRALAQLGHRVAVAGARDAEWVRCRTGIRARVEQGALAWHGPDAFDTAGFGRAASVVRQVGVGLRELALGAQQIAFFFVGAREHQREAILVIVAIAGNDADLVRLGAAATGRLAMVGRQFDTLVVLAQDEVDHAGHCIATVDARSAVLQHFDAVDRAQRDRVDVDVGTGAGAAGEVRQATAVDQYQGLVRTEAAQRYRRATVGGQARLACADLAACGRDRVDLAQQFFGRLNAALFDVGTIDDRHWQCGFVGDAADRRAGNFNALDDRFGRRGLGHRWHCHEAEAGHDATREDQAQRTRQNGFFNHYKSL